MACSAAVSAKVLSGSAGVGMRQVAPVSTRSAWVPDRRGLWVLFWSLTVPLATVRAVPVGGWKSTLSSVSVASPSAWMVAGMVMP